MEYVLRIEFVCGMVFFQIWFFLYVVTKSTNVITIFSNWLLFLFFFRDFVPTIGLSGCLTLFQRSHTVTLSILIT